MDREGFRNRLKQYKEAKGSNPLLKYWEWKLKYDSAPQPDSMPKQPTPDKKTKQPKEVENISHRADNPHTVLGREPFDSPYDDARYFDYRKPRFELRKGDVHYGNPNVLKWMSRFGKVLRGGSLFGETILNLFPSEEAELIEDLRVKMDKQNKLLTGLEAIPKYDEGTDGIRDNTYVAPIEKELVFIPATGALKFKQDLLNEITRNGQIKSGALDIVSPEFDLLTLGRGVFTNSLLPKTKIGDLPINNDIYYRMITDQWYGKSKKLGAINDIINSKLVRTKNSVFASPMFSKGKPYYNPDDYRNSYYIVSNNKKGLKWSTVDALGNPNNNPQGVAFTPLYNGVSNSTPKDYFDIYKYLGNGKYQQILSNSKVAPITGLNLIGENIDQYAEGGEVGDKKAIPTQEEYITQQIAAKKAAALKKSYDRQYPKVPTSGGKRSKADWENSLNRLEEYLNTLLSRWGITPSQKTIWLNNLKALQSQREAGYDAYIGEGKILGPSCAYTTGDNYGIDCVGSELFRLNHANYGFREIPYSQVQPSDVVLDYNPEEQRAIHTMMYSKKGSDGVARFNHSNGGHTKEAIRKDARYPFKGQPLAYEFVGTPADSTQWINDYKKLYGFADGGEVDDPRKQILNRSVKVASNYSDAKDFTLDPLNYAIRKISKTLTGRGGISNCTLSATGWVDPNNQYMSARNLFNNPESGYIEIDKAYALPGDLLVAKNPEKDSYHTMLIEGFNGDDPLLRYSRGGHNTKKNLVTGRSLEEYHRLDNEQGGNHTEDHYFRYNLPNEYWLPEIVVTPKR